MDGNTTGQSSVVVELRERAHPDQNAHSISIMLSDKEVRFMQARIATVITDRLVEELLPVLRTAVINGINIGDMSKAIEGALQTRLFEATKDNT